MPFESATGAREASADVATTAREEAGAVGREARHEAEEVVSEARRQISHVTDDAKRQLHDQASAQSDKVADGLERLGGQARALLDGNRQEAGPLADYADDAVAQLGQLADRVRSRGFDGLVEDTKAFARRRPGMFLAGAAAAGFLTGRLGRSAREERQEGSGVAEPSVPEPRTMAGFAAPAGVPPTSPEPGVPGGASEEVL
jgi:ElaB/YqjD/DUF883 family membrane-anchored ribosome-binding protein